MAHTIAAVSTGNVISAIGIIRLTGDDCVAIAEKVFTTNSGTSLSLAPSRKLMLGQLKDRQGRETSFLQRNALEYLPPSANAP